MKLINTVFHERKLRRVTRIELAEHIEISYNMLAKIENNLVNPSVRIALLIAEAFEMSVNELFKLKR